MYRGVHFFVGGEDQKRLTETVPFWKWLIGMMSKTLTELKKNIHAYNVSKGRNTFF